MTTHAPLRPRWTNAVSVYHAQVTAHGDSLPSPSKDTTLEAVSCKPLLERDSSFHTWLEPQKARTLSQEVMGSLGSCCRMAAEYSSAVTP